MHENSRRPRTQWVWQSGKILHCCRCCCCCTLQRTSTCHARGRTTTGQATAAQATTGEIELLLLPLPLVLPLPLPPGSFKYYFSTFLYFHVAIIASSLPSLAAAILSSKCASSASSNNVKGPLQYLPLPLHLLPCTVHCLTHSQSGRQSVQSLSPFISFSLAPAVIKGKLLQKKIFGAFQRCN